MGVPFSLWMWRPAFTFELSGGAAAQEDGNGIVAVDVAVAHAAAVEDHGVIEQRAFAVLRVLHFV